MHLVRYVSPDGPLLGVLSDAEIHPLGGAEPLADLLALPLAAIRERMSHRTEPIAAAGVQLLAPVDGRTEVWAAGVTYEQSKGARVTESQHEAAVYTRVYSAERPELFFKSVAWRVVGPGGRVSARADSQIDVPEPELAVVYNAYEEAVGYTICNDMSSRSIEAENPLYLPQAKVYDGACAIGPGIRPSWEVSDPYALAIRMTILRNGGVAWEGESSTASLHRRLDDLARYLFREQGFPEGVILSTGTSLVPDLPFSLRANDEVRIEISHVGTLTNTVVRGMGAL